MFLLGPKLGSGRQVWSLIVPVIVLVMGRWESVVGIEIESIDAWRSPCLEANIIMAKSRLVDFTGWRVQDVLLGKHLPLKLALYLLIIFAWV